MLTVAISIPGHHGVFMSFPPITSDILDRISLNLIYISRLWSSGYSPALFHHFNSINMAAEWNPAFTSQIFTGDESQVCVCITERGRRSTKCGHAFLKERRRWTIMRLEWLGKLKKIHHIGTRNCDLPALTNYLTACQNNEHFIFNNRWISWQGERLLGSQEGFHSTEFVTEGLLWTL
jgi:hypothetical protein